VYLELISWPAILDEWKLNVEFIGFGGNDDCHVPIKQPHQQTGCFQSHPQTTGKSKLGMLKKGRIG